MSSQGVLHVLCFLCRLTVVFVFSRGVFCASEDVVLFPLCFVSSQGVFYAL